MNEIYNHILTGLNNVNGVKMTALGSRDGFLYSRIEDNKTEIMTLMAASMIRAAETAAIDLDELRPNHVIVDFNGRKLIAASAGPKAVISVMATQDANLDPIINELDRTVDKIREIL